MKSKSGKFFLISVTLHAILGILGFFYWFGASPTREADSISALLIMEEKIKVRRTTPPKRTQMPKKTTQDVSQPRLKILTNNEPISNRGVVSASEATPFQQFGALNLDDSAAEPTSMAVEFEAAPRIQRVTETPFKKEQKTETRPKSKLVKFIEAQDGAQRIIYCVDLSTSTQNLPAPKFRRVVNLMRNSLTFLEAHDSFNIVAFSTELVMYEKEFLSMTAENVAASAAYLANIQSHIYTKGTDYDMLTALTEIAKTAPTIVVLFSDGIPTTLEKPNLTLVGQHAKGNGKIFAMGVGMAPNFPGAVMMKQLATVSTGDFWLVDR